MSLIQHLCKSLQAPAPAKRYRDAGIGFTFIILIQFLVIPIQIILDTHSVNLPASILVMLLSTFLMIVANGIHGGTAQFYSTYLRGPTDFLGRHMSFGFVASFMILNRDHISNALDVPRVAGAFLITSLLGYIGSFFLTLGTFQLESRFRGQRAKVHDLESYNKSWPSPSTAWPAPPADRSPKRISQLPRISAALIQRGSFASIEASKRGSASQFIDHLIRTSPLWICVLLIGIVGLPVYFATKYEAPFEGLCFVLFWILSIQFQRSLKTSCSLSRFPRLRSTLVVFANPVVVTSALGTAYLWIKTAYTGQTIGIIVAEFRRHNTLAEGIIDITRDGNLTAHIGAGDLASPVLDAGIVCMGFKMFEYRKELWDSFITVFTTCAILAVVNVFLNVVVSRGLGLQAEDAVAFAARSVTIALGVPAVQNLGGSTTLMSAIVIFGGIVFQMAGDRLFSLLRINDWGCQQKADGSSVGETEKTGAITVGSKESRQQDAGTGNSAIIAAGVTVGINAAAMGTAYLIERDSRATAYSALSMTVFGAITVALTALPGVPEAIASLASI
ncbi:hypothetical protein AAE478_003256 [Parahypoxylon ruwenzoriense]